MRKIIAGLVLLLTLTTNGNAQFGTAPQTPVEPTYEGKSTLKIKYDKMEDVITFSSSTKGVSPNMLQLAAGNNKLWYLQFVGMTQGNDSAVVEQAYVVVWVTDEKTTTNAVMNREQNNTTNLVFLVDSTERIKFDYVEGQARFKEGWFINSTGTKNTWTFPITKEQLLKIGGASEVKFKFDGKSSSLGKKEIRGAEELALKMKD